MTSVHALSTSEMFTLSAWLVLWAMLMTIIHEAGHYIVALIVRLPIVLVVVGDTRRIQVRIRRTWFCFGLPTTGFVLAAEQLARSPSGFKIQFSMRRARVFAEDGSETYTIRDKEYAFNVPDNRHDHVRALLFVLGGALFNFIAAAVALLVEHRSIQIYGWTSTAPWFVLMMILYGLFNLLPTAPDGGKAIQAVRKLYPHRANLVQRLGVLTAAVLISAILLLGLLLLAPSTHGMRP
jgi:hypothetical protein